MQGSFILCGYYGVLEVGINLYPEAIIWVSIDEFSACVINYVSKKNF